MTALGAMVAASTLLVLAGCAGGEPGAGPDRQLFCVSTTGSDQNTGSCTAPWRSIQKALNTLKPGQTALVRAGIYDEYPRAVRSGTKASRIVVRPYAGESVVLHGRLRIEADYIRIVGLRVDGKTFTQSTPLVYVRGATSVTLERLEIVNSVREGLLVSNNARDVTVIGCWVHSNGKRPKLDHGIVFARGRGGRIESTLVENNAAGGILIYPD